MKIIDLPNEIGILPDHKVLAFFPHPDDETAYAGGLLYKLVKQNTHLRLICLTKGEKSTLRNGLDENIDLGNVREEEFNRVMVTLGLENFALTDFGDLQLKNRLDDLKEYILNEIENFSPNYIITLEPQGVYGHPDHIALSQVISQIHISNPNLYQLIYITIDETYYIPSPAARAMAESKNIQPIKPNVQLNLDSDDTDTKIDAFRHYHSQHLVDQEFLDKWTSRRLLHHEFLHIVEV